MFFSLVYFHLDWSVEHFVSLLSNHFKRTHTHTHTSLLLWCPNLLLWMRVSESLLMLLNCFPSMLTTFSHSSHMIEFTSRLNDRHLGHVLAPSPTLSIVPSVVYLRGPRDKQLTVTHFLMTPCNTLSKPLSHTHSPYFLSLFQRRVVICCFIPRHLQLILLQWR